MLSRPNLLKLLCCAYAEPKAFPGADAYVQLQPSIISCAQSALHACPQQKHNHNITCTYSSVYALHADRDTSDNSH